MNILLLGPPGSGKSTQAAVLAERLGILQITASEILTAAADTESDDALLIAGAMDTGTLVPDEVVSRLLIVRLRQADCTAGFVLDGFPRTVGQAMVLDQAGIRLDYMTEIILEDAEVSGGWRGAVSISPPDASII
jgi:adenylate kinase